MRCPVTGCGAENPEPVAECHACGADLRAYAVALRFSDLCYNRALELARAGDPLAAQHDLHACLRFRPGDEEARLLLGKAQWAGGDRQAARHTWQRLQVEATDAAVKRQATRCLDAATATGAGRKRGASGKKSRKARRRARR